MNAIAISQPEDLRLVRQLVRYAAASVLTDTHAPAVRAELLEGAALLLDGEEADEASAAAAYIRQGEACQLRFLELIQK
jgi:hypothetical protein